MRLSYNFNRTCECNDILGDKHIDGTNDKFSTGFDSNRQWLKINRITDTDFFPEYTLEINGQKVTQNFRRSCAGPKQNFPIFNLFWNFLEVTLAIWTSKSCKKVLIWKLKVLKNSRPEGLKWLTCNELLLNLYSYFWLFFISWMIISRSSLVMDTSINTFGPFKKAT